MMLKKLLYSSLMAVALFGLFSCEDETQAQQSIVVNGGAEFLSLDSEPRTGVITVKTKQAWSVGAPAEQWLTLSATQGAAGSTEITVSLEQNTQAARYATLTFTDGVDSKTFVVSQSAPNTGFDSPTHYFYITAGTMPTLYAGLFMLSHNAPSYFFYERTNTFDPAKFPSYVTMSPFLGGVEIQKKMRDYMKAKILEVNRENPTAVFGLLVDDLRARLGYDWFVGQGIDSSRVKVTLVSDGTGTYNEFYNNFNNTATAETKWNEYVTTIDALNWNHSGKYPSTRVIPEFDSWSWAYYLSTRPNYRLLLQDDSLLETESPYIKEQIAKMDMLNQSPYDMLNALPKAQQDEFYAMAKFDRASFEAMFEASPKPNLIIIGTNGKPKEQRSYTDRIYKQYGETHDIFFKPHPADKSSEDYEKVFAGLKLLPGQMPFEIFVWSLLDQIDVIGGFQSTVFMTVPVEKVRFFFEPNASSLPRPLNLIFANAENIEWIQ